MKIHIVRHGQTEWNKEKKMQGSKNSNLTEKGIEEAKKLGNYLKDKEFDIIYSSPLGRTVETTEHIKGKRDIDVVYLEDLQEMDFGHMEGRVMKEVENEYGDMIYNLWNDPENYENNSGESFSDVFERVERVLNEIISKEEYEDIILVTHGVIISVIFAIVEGKGIGGTWDTPVVDNTSVSILEVNDGEIEILERSSIKHLS